MDQTADRVVERASGEVGFNRSADETIALGVAHTEQGVALFDPLIIQKGLIGLIHIAVISSPAQVLQAPARQE